MAIDTSNISFINYLWTKKNGDGTLTGIRLSKDNLPEYLADPIPILAGKNISITSTNAGIEISASADGKVKTVNTVGPDANGNVTIPIPTAGTTASAIGTKASGGNATTWSKSDHVHNISLDTGDANGQVKIAGINVSVKGLGSAAYTNSTAYATSGHTHSFSQITSRGEAFLDWGGKNFSGSYGPIDAAMVPELGANRLAFMPAAAVTVEYSRDGGSTWTDYGPTDSQKINLFNGLGSSFTIGKATKGEGNIATNKYQLRVNIYTSTGHVYTALNKFVIYLSTSGTKDNWCTIRARTQSDYTAGNDKWTTFADKIRVSGWSGYNVINTSSITTYGNTVDTQYGHIQFIFGCDTGSTNNSYPGLQINKIFGFGGVGWTTPSTMAKTGHMYTYDSSQNVTFPAGVSAKSFTENGTSLANKYLGKTAKAADADKLDGNDSTYYLNYNNLTNKPTIPAAANNGTITIKQTGISDQTFTVNQSSNTTITLVDTNTWRPLGTGASDACAGNDARLSNARTPTAHTHTSNDVTDSLALIQGKNITLTQTASGIEISAAADGKVKTVNNQQPDSNGNVQLTAANVGALPIDNASDSLNINKELACGSNGKICVGKFGIYDSNITLNVSSTTSNTYNGTIIIATQNGIICTAKVYGDATKALSNILYIAQESYNSSSKRGVVGVYLNLAGWSKNKIDIRCLKLDKTILNTYYTNLMTSITAMPTYSEGAPNTATSEPKKYTGTKNDIFGAIPTSLPASDVYAWAKAATKPTYTASEVGALVNNASVVYYTAQSLNDTQKAQARTNIGAGTSSFTGYTSSNKLHTDYINNAAGWTSNKGTVTSVRVQAGTGLSSSQNTAQTSTLNTTISIASGYKLPTTTEWADIPSISGAYSILAGKNITLTQTADGLEISAASNQDISGKLDKVTTKDTYQLYGKNANGEQQMLDYSTGTVGWSIVQRDANGCVNVANPTDTYNATTKQYVDGRSGVTGVKGNSETSYRTGNVNITKSNIGLSKVRNVSSYSKTETDNLLAQKIDKGKVVTSVTIGLTHSLGAYDGTSQSITHTANQEVVFDGYSNDSVESIADTKSISLKRTSDTNTNVYIQMYSRSGGFIDEITIYYHIVTYNS